MNLMEDKEAFKSIVMEYGLSEELAKRLWKDRPNNLTHLDEDTLRTTCEIMQRRFQIADKMTFIKNTLLEWDKS